MSPQHKFVFIAGVMGRSGTNYLARALLAHPAVCRPRGHWELTVLEAAPEFRAFYQRYRSTRGDRTPFAFEEVARALGDGLLLRMEERLVEPPEGEQTFLLHKNPSTVGVEHFYDFFPEGKLILLLRDGRDVVNSLLSAQRLTRRWGLKKSYLQFRHAATWAARARGLRSYRDDALRVRYEDLNADPAGELARVAGYLGLPAHPSWLEEVAALPVSGSNFFRGDAESAAEGTDWQEHERNEAFRPLGRWRQTWTPIDKGIYRLVAGREGRRAGYA